MIRKSKLIGCLSILGLLLAGIPVSAQNSSSSQTSLNLNVGAGTLSLSAPSSASFDSVALDDIPDSGAISQGSLNNMVIRDHRPGSSNLWSVTVDATDFTTVSGSVIPASALSISTVQATGIGNSSTENLTTANNISFGEAETITLIQAEGPGSSKGRFEVDTGLELYIDVATEPTEENDPYTATWTTTII